MDIFQIFLFITFIIGVAVALFAAAPFSARKEDTGELSVKKREYDAVVADADATYEALSELSSDMIKQIDDKYKELLFVYNLIDEKKSDTAKSMSSAKNPAALQNRGGGSGSGFDKIITDDNIPAFKSPKYKEIKDLQAKGLSVAEIARALKIGKGEVQLILDLGRVR